jgi:carbonic anhydrase/acetyltransferase-like protein (isoleucine patch superfamily)
MNAVIMDEVEIGENSIIGALTFIKAGEKIAARSLMAGNPAKLIREVSDEMIQWKTEGTLLYQKLPAECFETLRPALPLTEASKSQSTYQAIEYSTWKGKQQGV